MLENPLALKRYNFVLNQVSNYANGRKLTIMDIGCGSGALSFPLAQQGHKVVGIDNDDELVRQCAVSNKYPNAKFLKADAQYIVDTKKYDVVICCEMLEHTQRPEWIAWNIRHLLKQSGILILTVPNGYSLSELVLCRLFTLNGKTNRMLKIIRPVYGFITNTKVSRNYPFYMDSLHVQFFSLNNIRYLFQGFKLETIQNTDMGILYPSAGRMAGLKKIECKVVDIMPHNIIGGWMMVLKNG